MELLLSICLGLGLAAACGFRVFVPLLVMSVAAKSGQLQLASGFEWIGSTPAIAAFTAATILEIAAYYVPWVDNLLDTISTPAAVVAGTIVTASAVSGMDPLFSWSLAIIAGGGAAAMVQTATVSTRAASSAFTGGLGNPVVSTVEGGAALLLSALAVLVPIIAAIFAIAIVLLLVRAATAWRTRVRPRTVA